MTPIKEYTPCGFPVSDKHRPLLIEGVVNSERTPRIHPLRASSKTEYGQTVQADR